MTGEGNGIGAESGHMELAREPERILVIKHGALGDFVLAFGPFKAIRRHHPHARIVLLTTAPYADFAAESGLFDEIWIDERASLFRPWKTLATIRRIARARFTRVYDLQTSTRTDSYFSLLPPWRRPQWNGTARGASHRYDDSRRASMHTLERQAAQLAVAGIDDVRLPDLSWVARDTSRFGLPRRYVLLVPGGSAHRLEKRWPARKYGRLADALHQHGLTSVLIGAEAEVDVIRDIRKYCPSALDLTGATDFGDIVALARRATSAVGNDTGPMHLIAASGAPSVVLFSSASDPARARPRGRAVRVLQRNDLAVLSVDEVVASLPEARELTVDA